MSSCLKTDSSSTRRDVASIKSNTRATGAALTNICRSLSSSTKRVLRPVRSLPARCKTTTAPPLSVAAPSVRDSCKCPSNSATAAWCASPLRAITRPPAAAFRSPSRPATKKTTKLTCSRALLVENTTTPTASRLPVCNTRHVLAASSMVGAASFPISSCRATQPASLPIIKRYICPACSISSPFGTPITIETCSKRSKLPKRWPHICVG